MICSIISLKTAEPLRKRSGGPFLGEGLRAMLEGDPGLTGSLEQKKSLRFCGGICFVPIISY